MYRPGGHLKIRGEFMKKVICSFVSTCVLALSLAAVAQSGDNMKHDDMKQDQMNDQMKKDMMKKDDMKKDDNMKHDDGMKQN
jgi:pentapeptide MXKDX repeat protein